MNINFKSFVVGFVALMWLSASAYAGSLATPELDAPKDKAKNQVLTTVLKWKPVPGAKGYRVFVSASDAIKNLVPGAACKDCFVDEKTDKPTYQIPPKRLKKDIPYFWTVRAVSGTEEGPVAPVRSYTMASTFFMDMD
ncbi:MAG: hypothetical protein EHM85_02835 [Desulfobacteraceae bacterium]|nr:MAG: hypothetical protein EHM85_02835 [Desulfobacteraceae bacterium]